MAGQRPCVVIAWQRRHDLSLQSAVWCLISPWRWPNASYHSTYTQQYTSQLIEHVLGILRVAGFESEWWKYSEKGVSNVESFFVAFSPDSSNGSKWCFCKAFGCETLIRHEENKVMKSNTAGFEGEPSLWASKRRHSHCDGAGSPGSVVVTAPCSWKMLSEWSISH